MPYTIPKSNHQKRELTYQVVSMTPGEKIEPPNVIVFIMVATGAMVEDDLLLELEADEEETGEVGIRGNNSGGLLRIHCSIDNIAQEILRRTEPILLPLDEGEKVVEGSGHGWANAIHEKGETQNGVKKILGTVPDM
ncbi:hypothetical protein K435DRAFT_798905 [Dendrothele bispora CBS 962.96]|uniref:Uncharacterized protein n=1 Tax=Dendrothele bispora (strain CBS 962.96) TaxID=1314807 RepID=A0A4S8LZ05_DENBC|nr:hypothetical protein K435DRAFT_798905 [Dendrothele bispora CBS 962.96]